VRADETPNFCTHFIAATSMAPRSQLLRCYMALFFARKRCENMKGRTKVAICVFMASIAMLVVGALMVDGSLFAFSPSTCLIAPNPTASCVWYNYGRAAFWFPRLTNVTLASDGSACPLLFHEPFSEESACLDAWAGCRGQQCDISGGSIGDRRRLRLRAVPQPVGPPREAPPGRALAGGRSMVAAACAHAIDASPPERLALGATELTRLPPEPD
jgi:hypothetical protein